MLHLMYTKYLMFLFISVFLIEFELVAQKFDTLPSTFKIIKLNPYTSIKNQYRSSTCWSFTAISLIESDLIKEGKGKFNLSEMFIVRQAYMDKAEKYIRMHGSITFGGGGTLSDPIDIIKKYGIVPANVYSGLVNGQTRYVHSEMDVALKSYVDSVINNKKVLPIWKEGFTLLLDRYLGKLPDKFRFNNTEYTAISYANMLGINWNNYILLSSFCNKPYYQKSVVEVPDNWSWGAAYNLPLVDFKEVIDSAINSGYTIAIATDVSEKGFMWDKGLALADNDPDSEFESTINPSMWIPRKDTSAVPYIEIEINPLMRQQAFDNYETTDDHSMQIVGLAVDNFGKQYYVTKNSWGTEYTLYNGILYISGAFLMYKTITLLVNKNSVPSKILKKLDFKE